MISLPCVVARCTPVSQIQLLAGDRVPRLGEQVVRADLHRAAFFIREAQVVRIHLGGFDAGGQVVGHLTLLL